VALAILGVQEFVVIRPIHGYSALLSCNRSIRKVISDRIALARIAA
jgi:hypothetical protein